MNENLKGKKILVTGGAGFIGSHIVSKLLEVGAEIVVLDNLYSGKLENLGSNVSKIKFIQKDLRDDLALEEALDGIDMVSHQAALRSVPESVKDPGKYNDVNVNGSLKLFIKAKEKK